MVLDSLTRAASIRHEIAPRNATRLPREWALAGSCLCLMLALGTPTLVAEEAAFSLTLPLVLNGRYLGDLAGEVSLTGNAWVEYERLLDLLSRHLDETALTSLREHPPARGMFPIGERATPPLDIQYAPQELSIRVEAPHEFFASREISISGTGVPDARDYLATANASMALDVLYNQEYIHRTPLGERGRAPATALLEGRGNLGGPGGVNLATAALYNEGAEQRLQRRDARLFHDDRTTATRYTVGDIIPGVQGFQQSPRLAGASVSRLYGEIQPYRNIRSSGQREIILERPSSVDVEIDGVVVRSEQLPPGRYDLRDFPLAIGSNEVRLLVEDDLGRREAARFDPYHHPELLAPGTRLFDASLGRIQAESEGSIRYSNRHAFTGFTEQGLNERTTLGADLQISEEGYHSTGLALRTGHRAGVTGLNVSRSGFHKGDDDSGYAYGMSHQWNRRSGAERPLSLNLHADYLERDYRSLIAPDSPSSRRLTMGARTNFRLAGNWSAGIGMQRQSFHEEVEPLVRQELSFSRGFSGRGNLFTSFQRSSGGATDQDSDRYAANVGLSWRFGERGLVRSQYLTRDQRSRVQVQRLGGSGIHDLGARSSVTRSSDTEEVDAGLRYRGNRANLEYQAQGTRQRGVAAYDDSRSVTRLETGLAWADGHFGMAPRVGNGFAIYQPHESLREHRIEIRDSGGRRLRARSDFLGAPTVPLQRAYVPETLQTSVPDLPLGYDLGAQQERLLPGAFSGHVIPIGSEDNRTVLGFLVDADGEGFRQLTGSLVRISDGERIPMFTNRMGRFVAERVAPGEYEVELGQWRSVENLVISSDAESLIDAGTIEMR